MSRKSPNLGLNVNESVASVDLYPLASRSSTPHSDQQAPSSAAGAATTAAAVLHMVQQKAATFELRGRHTRHEQANNYGAHSTASVGRHVQATKKSPSSELQTLPAPATRTILPVPQPRNFLTLDWLHGNSADTEDSSDNNAGSGAANGQQRRRAQVQSGRCSVPTVLGNTGNSAQYLLDKKMESLYLGNALRALPLGAEASQYQNERYYLEDYSSGSGNERLPGEADELEIIKLVRNLQQL